MTPHYTDPMLTLYLGDCLEVMPTLPDASVDAVVTDPPYGLEFMGKEWDRLDAGLPQENVWKGRRGKGGSNIGTDDSKPGSRHHVSYSGKKVPGKRCVKCGKRSFSGSPCVCPEPEWVLEYTDGAPSSMIRMQRWHERWAREAFRLLKPGGHLLAFGGTRTYHRLASAIEDAGFEIRDCLVWAYASGFPKSLDVGKAIDRAAGAEREDVLQDKPRAMDNAVLGKGLGVGMIERRPATDDAKRWDGWGTALKPAWEPIVMARKPLQGTVAANVLRHGVGALNIDGTRIPGAEPYAYPNGPKGNVDPTSINLPRLETPVESNPAGRWPANVILTDPIFDGDTPGVVGGGDAGGGAFTGPTARVRNNGLGLGTPDLRGGSSQAPDQYGDTGTYSRFFLIPKEARAGREPAVRGQLVERGSLIYSEKAQGPLPQQTPSRPSPRENVHPTVKPLELMRHLVRLVTPPGGTVLDCFLGSGTTALAAIQEGFRCIGIEREAPYMEITMARLHGTQTGIGL